MSVIKLYPQVNLTNNRASWTRTKTIPSSLFSYPQCRKTDKSVETVTKQFQQSCRQHSYFPSRPPQQRASTRVLKLYQNNPNILFRKIHIPQVDFPNNRASWNRQSQALCSLIPSVGRKTTSVETVPKQSQPSSIFTIVACTKVERKLQES